MNRITEITDPLNEVAIEDRDIYDGWCAIYYKDTQTIKIRDAYFTKHRTDEEWEEWIQKQLPFLMANFPVENKE